MNVYQILDRKSVDPSIQAKTKREILEQLADLMARSGKVPDKNALVDALLEREELCSTAVGEGVAIPHAKCEGMTEMCVAVAIAKEGVDFDAIDNKPVSIMFGLTGPPGDPEQHIRILSRIARIARNQEFRSALVKAETADEVFKVLVEEETRHAYEEEKAERKVVAREKRFLILVLYDEDLLDEILEYLLEVGMGAGIVTEGTSLVDAVSRKIPLFADFAGMGTRTRGYARAIHGIVRADRLNGIVSGLEEIIGDLDESDKATLFALDVEHIKGSLKVS
jgi:fructose-specific phosphotransferase system IIA component